MKTIKIRDEFIKLGQAMKLAGCVDSGVEAKEVIQNGEVEVNGEVDLRRGRKLKEGDVFTFGGESYQIGK
ncbi:MAG: RNA-binding S4 domain-containing protein [Clostridiales bacterium]|nr:RNA-binding S4 domain-containing protein [Clostridiales bacterium]